MKFLAFLIISLSVSNAALLPANFLGSSDQLFPSLPLLDSPLSGSVSPNGPVPGNEPSPFSLNLNAFDPNNNPISSSPSLDPPLPGSLLSLNQPALGNNPSLFSLDGNAFNSAINPISSYSLGLAQQPNGNGAGDGGDPSITYAETQAQTDDSNGECSLDRITDQKRRKRDSSYCVAPGMVEFHPRTPVQSPEGSTPEERKNDGAVKRDAQWVGKRFKEKFGSKWRNRPDQELMQELNLWTVDSEKACEKQSRLSGSYIRAYPLCCMGPMQTMPADLQIGLAPRQEPDTLVNWFNCDYLIPGRPFCDQVLTHAVCCERVYGEPDPRNREPASWWRWGLKGVDCVDLLP